MAYPESPVPTAKFDFDCTRYVRVWRMHKILKADRQFVNELKKFVFPFLLNYP